jgi:hypothetical protein
MDSCSERIMASEWICRAMACHRMDPAIGISTTFHCDDNNCLVLIRYVHNHEQVTPVITYNRGSKGYDYYNRIQLTTPRCKW